jgi:hypothetical protein
MKFIEYLNNLNIIRRNINQYYLVKETERNNLWFQKVLELKTIYMSGLKQIQFGKFIPKDINKGKIKDAFKEKKINVSEYNNFKYNQEILVAREKHPVIYFLDNGKKLYFSVKTNSTANVKLPLKDSIDINPIKQNIKVIQLLDNTNIYCSNVTFIIEFKDEGDFNTLLLNIENNDDYMNHYFNKKDLRVLQKEKAFELFYRTIFKKDPEKLLINIDLNNNFQILADTTYPLLVDVTFDKYLIDDIDRISNYENYRKES